MQRTIALAHPWTRRPWAVAAFATIAMSVGCDSYGPVPPYPSECPSSLCDKLGDTSAGRLALYVGLEDTTSVPPMTLIRVEFHVPSDPEKLVDFVAGEKVSCDGVAYTRFPAAFGRDVPTASIAGRTLKCVYTSGKQSTDFDFIVPDHLEILTPSNHERVQRSARTTITYKNRVAGINLGVTAASDSGGVSYPLTDAFTMTSAVVDTRSLNTGPGYILISEPVFDIAVHGAGFQSAGGFQAAAAKVFVTWA